MNSLKGVMESRNIAVIGASRDPVKLGSLLLKALKDTGFKGQIAGVNPGGGEVNGVRLYRSLDEIPFPVELAVMLIPPRVIPPALNDCARKGVKGVVISSEGFAETGEEGLRYQEEVSAIFRSTGMRGFGPNTMGIVNTDTGLATSYFVNKHMLRPGSIGVAAQSGIFVGALLRYLSSCKVFRMSKVLGLGNKVDVDESDALSYLREDEQTRIVAMYLEDIRDGKRFLKVAKEAVMQKPILLLKGGRTSEGARATATHTASMAMDDRVLTGALSQAGVLPMRSIEELMATINGFQFNPLPQGNRIALVTYSGAQAIMSIDAATERGLMLSRFSRETVDRLSRVIATPSKRRNPVDIFPDMMAHGFEKTGREVLLALLEDGDVHGIFFISFATPTMEPYLPLVEEIRERRSKPVFFSLLGIREDVEACRSFLEDNGIPFNLFPEMSVQVFSNMWRYARTARALPQRQRHQDQLTQDQPLPILEAHAERVTKSF
jgi:acyl-CoA synthetase (NDP forming)